MPSRTFIVAVAIFAIGLGACSSSSKSTSAPSANTSAGLTPTTANSGGGSGAASGGGSGGGSFCDEVRNDQDAFQNSSIATKTPADLKTLYSKLVPALEHAQSEAPSAIKADFATFITGFKALNSALDAAGYDVRKLSPSSLAGLDSADFKAASDHIETYITQVCHIAPPTT